MQTTWNPGADILLRGVWRNKIWWAIPVTVVRDEPDLIAVYWRAGTPNKTPEQRPKPQDLLSEHSLPLIDSQWIWTDVLMLVPPTAAHAIYAMWETDHKLFHCWYINLQSPLKRTRLGFDTMDFILDIVISPDLSVWHWKDEDDFNEAVRLGVYTADEAQAIRLEGERVIQQMQARLSPFCDGWESWKPPEDWHIPVFPPGWEELY
jgi:Protein of unknown function (DUF402)